MPNVFTKGLGFFFLQNGEPKSARQPEVSRLPRFESQAGFCLDS